MNLVFYFRNKQKGGTSIEEIFSGITENLIGRGFNVGKCYIGEKKNILSYVLKKNTILHITGDVLFLAFFLFIRPLVITIHDIGAYKQLSGIKKFLFGWLWIKGPIILSDKITVVSQYTKDDIALHFGEKYVKKVVVIHNPIPSLFSQASEEKTTKTPSTKFTILHIGTGKHKNLPTLISALHQSKYHLIIIGQLDGNTRHLLSNSDFTYEQYENLPYKEVVEQYKKCDLLSFVSLHEGFGMPVIEAQVLGKPVLTSRVTSIPEVAQDSVLYIENPLDPQEIRSGIDKIAHDPSFRNLLIEKGETNAKRFTFERIVDQYIQLYKSIL